MSKCYVDILEQMMSSGTFDACAFETIKPIIKQLPIVPIIIPSKAKMIRSSSNNEWRFHDNIDRLSYPPAEYAKLARANIDGMQMFYACVFNTFENEHEEYAIPPRVVSAFETSYLFKDFETSGKMCTTQSLWFANRPLKLIVIPNTKEWKRPSRELKQIQEQVLSKKGFAGTFNSEDIDLAVYLGNLFSEPAHSCLYEITSRVAYQLLTDSAYSDDVDGIAYPSVKCGGAGFNICVKPSAVDECFSFQGAMVTMIIKDGRYTTMFQIANSVEFPNGELKWQPTCEAYKILYDFYGAKILNDRNIIEYGEVPKG